MSFLFPGTGLSCGRQRLANNMTCVNTNMPINRGTKHIHASTNYLPVSSLFLPLTCRYGHAYLLPDFDTAHSCMPRAFAISNPKPGSHQPHSTASISPADNFTAGRQAGPSSAPHPSSNFTITFPIILYPTLHTILTTGALLFTQHHCLTVFQMRKCISLLLP